MKCFQKVLLLDDDPTHNFIFQKLINQLDFTQNLEICSSVREALDYLDETALIDKSLPELILLDIQMPEMSGWDFLESYQTLKSKLKTDIHIIMISSVIRGYNIQKSKRFPELKAYYEKPLTVARLATIKDMLL